MVNTLFPLHIYLVRDAFKIKKSEKGTLSQKVEGGPNNIPSFEKYFNWDKDVRRERMPMVMS